MQAPDFALPDQNGTIKTLADFAGKWIVLYFYPKDETPGCTAEACSFRDANESLLAKNAVVVGISKDSVESHAAFIRGHQLPFTLLSDPEKITIQAYDAWGKAFMGHIGTLRKTFIIDPAGQIVREFPKVTPADHATQILQTLEALQQK